MVKKTVRELIFFILLFLLFFLVKKLADFWISKGTPADYTYIGAGLLYTLVMVGIFFLAKLQTSKENFWDVSEFAQCKGGPYMWQGDSEQATMCRKLAETPEGRCGIASYNCPTGTIGTPSLPFIYTPLSGDDWSNERCEDKPTCGCPYDQGLCSGEKSVA